MRQFIRRTDFETLELDGEWLVLDSQKYTVTTLNEVGGYCWKLLQEKRTTEEVADSVKLHFSSEGNTLLHQDIEMFLADLLKCGLIEYANE